MRWKKGNWLRKSIIQLVLLSFAGLFLTPIIYIVYYSLSFGGISNYEIVIRTPFLPRFFINSIVVTGSCILIVVGLGSLAAYAFSQLKFPAKNGLFYLLLIGIMVPTPSIVIPLFQLMRKMGLINNYLALIGPYVAINLPYPMLVMKNYFDDIPKAISEAAVIEGCGSFAVFRKIMMPLSVPALAVAIVWTFLFSWTEFLFAMVFMPMKQMQTIPMAALYYNGLVYFTGKENELCAIILVIMLPTIVAYILLQGLFIKGMTAGALKG